MAMTGQRMETDKRMAARTDGAVPGTWIPAREDVRASVGCAS
jgi:hypothetical protein